MIAATVAGLASAAVMLAVGVRVTQRAILRDRGPAWLPGVVPADVTDVADTLARTAHLYRGFGRDRAIRMAIRRLDRTGRSSPRVQSMSTLECGTLGRSTWFRLEDGTAARIDSPVATVRQDPATATDTPERLLEHAELVAAHRRPRQVVLQFRDGGTRIELRGSGAAIL